MMIYFWGIEVFGIWMFLISIPYSLSIINADISTPITNKMSYFYNKKDKKEIDKIYSNFTIITLINIFIISVIFIFIYFTIDINLKILENLSLNEIKLSLLLITLSFLLILINSLFISKINHTGNIYVSNNIITFFDFITKVILILSFFISNDFVILPIVFFVLNLFKSLVFLIFCRNSNVSFNYLYCNFNYIKKLLKESIGYILSVINSIFKNNFQIFLLGLFFNSTIVGMISTCKTIFYFIPDRILSILLSTFEYEIIEAYRKKKFYKLKKNIKNFQTIFLITALIIILFLIIFGMKFYNLWTQDNYLISHLLIFLILFDSLINKCSESLYIVDKSLNKFLKLACLI